MTNLVEKTKDRVYGKLEKILSEDEFYIAMKRDMVIAEDRMNNTARLSADQMAIVDAVISASNGVANAYAEAAYRLGYQDAMQTKSIIHRFFRKGRRS